LLEAAVLIYLRGLGNQETVNRPAAPKG
jgi:hypothetical protein